MTDALCDQFFRDFRDSTQGHIKIGRLHSAIIIIINVVYKQIESSSAGYTETTQHCIISH